MKKTVTVLGIGSWYELSTVSGCGWAHQLEMIPEYDPNLTVRGNSQALGPIRWSVIADFLAHGVDVLRRDAIGPGPIGTFDYDFTNMTQGEEHFAIDWFYTGPQGDPWTDALTNGRHRLAWMTRGVPGVVLPIKSDALAGARADEEACPSCDVEAVRSGLAAYRHVLAPTVLNEKYVSELRRQYGL